MAGTCPVLAGVLAWERRGCRAAYRRSTALAFLSLAVAAYCSGSAGAAAGGDQRLGRHVYQGDILEWLHRTPVDLCVTAFLLLAAVMLAVDPLRRMRLALRHVRAGPPPARAPPAFSPRNCWPAPVVAGLLGLLARLVRTR